MSVQRECEIRVLGERLQTEIANFVDRILADGTDRARYDGNAVPAGIARRSRLKPQVYSRA